MIAMRKKPRETPKGKLVIYAEIDEDLKERFDALCTFNYRALNAELTIAMIKHINAHPDFLAWEAKQQDDQD